MEFIKCWKLPIKNCKEKKRLMKTIKIKLRNIKIFLQRFKMNKKSMIKKKNKLRNNNKI